MHRLLTICPSRGRPKRLKEMLKSYYDTSLATSDLIIYLNDDDPCLEEYKEVLNNSKWGVHIVGRRMYLAEAYNYIFHKHPDYEYYAPVNDDHVFMTDGWDDKLIDVVETQGHGWGLAAAEDHLTDWKGWQHPSGMVISGNIPRTLGYMIWPKIQHIGIDDYFQHLLQGIDRLFHVPEVLIEHRHWINGKGFLDANYRFVYGMAQQSYGIAAAQEYLATKLSNDVAKLKEAMKNV
jgi:glycosyl transferase/beta-hydroxylase protein BlmF